MGSGGGPLDRAHRPCQSDRNQAGQAMTRILCVGIAVVDFVFRYRELPRVPGKHIADGLDAVLGGMAGNAAVAAAKLGAERPDEPARRGRQRQVRPGRVAVARARPQRRRACARVPTSMSAVAVDEGGERMLFNHQDRRLLLDAPAPAAAAYRRFDAAADDTRWPAAGVLGLHLAVERGVPGVADIDHAIEPEWLLPTLGRASHVVFSRDGLEACLGVDGIGAGLAEARRLASGRLAVTLGGEGVAWADGITAALVSGVQGPGRSTRSVRATFSTGR